MHFSQILRSWWPLLICCALWCKVINIAEAQDDRQQPRADGPTSAARQQFDTRFQQWKSTLQEMRTLRTRFQNATPGERPAMQQQFAKLLQQATSQLDELVGVAEKAYVASPENNEDVGGFLVDIVRRLNALDRYNEALRLAKLLIDSNVPDQRVLVFGGLAAYHANQYATASTYLHAADQAGLLEESAQAIDRRSSAIARQLAGSVDQANRYWQQEQALRQAEAEADDLPRVKLQTTKGEMVIELFENEAPNTVANFISLAQKGFYDGVKFHRVLPGFMAQTGCPQGDGTGGPGYRIRCECREGDFRRHFRGSVSMAKQREPDTGGSQFYLVFSRATTQHLDGQHTVFGRILSGMDVLNQLVRVDPSQPAPGIEPDRIESATVLRSRDHDYTPETLPE